MVPQFGLGVCHINIKYVIILSISDKITSFHKDSMFKKIVWGKQTQRSSKVLVSKEDFASNLDVVYSLFREDHVMESL